ncbi:MAG: enoyl-CoA hydratase/isomerase family protein [Hellea sp.]
MKKPLTFEKLKELSASHPPRENFGPNSEMPYLAFDLDGPEASLGAWLKDLPCPVIGIGHGALSGACDVVLETDKKLTALANNINNAPLAAMVLVQHLRASERLSLQDALTAESFAYSAVQIGPEFQKWLTTDQGNDLPKSNTPSVVIDIEGGTLSLSLNRPDTRNAIGVDMRDALCEALDLALMDEKLSRIRITGNGATFSTGGAIEEFGEVPDPATAHWVRSLRLPAWRLARLADKLDIHVNGAAIGAGAEIAGFGNHVTASPKAWFQLPELKYGLIPGAGGTASIPRRIGRQKTAYMALSMEKLRAETALKWGLIDEIT